MATEWSQEAGMSGETVATEWDQESGMTGDSVATEWQQEAGMYGETSVDNVKEITDSAVEASVSAAASEANAESSANAASVSAAEALSSENESADSAAASALSATASANSATAANTSANNASTSETSAANSASAASTSETNAAASESAAEGYANDAAVSEANAATSETNAATSETNAATSASTASTQATNSANSATASATSATNSANSATAAANSASAASTSESNASTSASTATTQAGIATTQAGIATSEASDAATSAATATTQAGIATTQATNSSNSATASQTSATNSASSASASASSATQSANSASTAASEASTATSERVAAETAELAASGHEVAAQGYATDALNYRNDASTASSDAQTSADTATTQAGIATSQATTATTQAGIATTQATNAASSATAAQASLDEFQGQYHGALATVPTVNVDTGDLYFDTALNAMRVYDGSAWVAAGSTVNGTSTRQTYTATASQTAFTVTGGYDAGFADVYLNGVKLVNGVDVDVSSGTGFTLTTGATVGDNVDFIGYGAFEVANTYTRAEVDSFLGSGLNADLLDGLDSSQFLRSDVDDTMTGRLVFPDAGYSIGDGYHTWKRNYTVNSSTPKELLYHDGTSLPSGGAYRFHAHIAATGTDQSATAVYWNQNGTWKVNVTYQSGISSNYPEFIIGGSPEKPQIHIDHVSNYTITVLGERLELSEGSGTDNQSGFGTDAFLGSVGGTLRYNNGGDVNSYEQGSLVWHSGNDGSGSGLDADTVDGLHASQLGGATGGGNDKIFTLNGQVVTTSYSIPSGKNAMTAGSITINNGVTITIPNGSSWTIV